MFLLAFGFFTWRQVRHWYTVVLTVVLMDGGVVPLAYLCRLRLVG